MPSRALLCPNETGEAQPQVLGGGRYELCEFVGKGGMGAVYRARDTELDRPVAVKCMIDVTTTRARERAMHEARTLAALSHPHIMRIYDVLSADEQVWIVSEWLDGQPLARLRGPLPPGVVLAIVAQVYDALAAAHAAQVVHRDIKPSNVMIGPHGRVTLIDFGVAFAPGWSTGETVVGSLRYTDPRILEGRPPDAFSDLFSAALMQVELMTGETVLPDLAPLPLYRHTKKHLSHRLDRLCEGTYPPLAALAREGLGALGRGSDASTAARTLALLAQDQLRRLTPASPTAYLEATICLGKWADPQIEKRLEAQIKQALGEPGLTPREKAAWVAYQRARQNPGKRAKAPPRRRRRRWLTVGVATTTVVASLALLLFATKKMPPTQPEPTAPDQAVIKDPDIAGSHGATPPPQILAAPTPAPAGHPILAQKDDAITDLTTLRHRPASGEIVTPPNPAPPTPRPNKAKANMRQQRDVVASAKGATAPEHEEAHAPLPLALESRQSHLPPAKAPLSLPLSKGDISRLVRQKKSLTPIYLVSNIPAVVYVDGTKSFALPRAEPFLLKPGRRRIRVTSEVTEPVEIAIIVAPDKPRKFRFNLRYKRTTRTLALGSPGRLFVDGIDHGVVTRKTLELTFGQHEVWIKRPKRILRPRNITINDATPSVIKLEEFVH